MTQRTLYMTDSEGIYLQALTSSDDSVLGITTPLPVETLLPKQVYQWQGDFTNGAWKKVFDLRNGGAFNTKDATSAITKGIFETLPAGLTTEEPQDNPIFNLQRNQWEEDTSVALKQAKDKKKQALKREIDKLLATGKSIDIGGKQRRFRALQAIIDRLSILVLRLSDGQTSKFENYNPQGEEDGMTGKSQSLRDDWYPEYAFSKSEFQTILGSLEAYRTEKKEAQHNACRLIETASTIDAVNKVSV